MTMIRVREVEDAHVRDGIRQIVTSGIGQERMKISEDIRFCQENILCCKLVVCWSQLIFKLIFGNDSAL